MTTHFHEQLHRGPELMDRLASFRVSVCGAGALGALETPDHEDEAALAEANRRRGIRRAHR